LLFYGWQHYQWIQYGYRIEEAQKKKEQLSEVARQLRLERASLRNPHRIDAIARGELGMVVPVPGQLVTFKPEAPLRIPVPEPQPVSGEMAAKR
jgi:cell division protein FtsL